MTHSKPAGWNLVVYNLSQPTDNTTRRNKLNAMSRFVFHFILYFNGYYYYYFSSGCEERTLFMLCIISLGDLLKEELPHIYHLVEVAHKPVSMK